ncbi:K(+)-transporting ATPase subunit F [Nannocystis sp.]|nr:K(+)-transporting ATPase subunit F [Nannocystis sp.]MBK9754555.1 K(+)-transporting ATPase subunit F [Nannocystis sp.]
MLSFEAIAAVLAVLLAAYLLVALLNPERFQ